MSSADRVDLPCAFIRWAGVRILEQPLAELRERGVPLRVITTTYVGATERRALDELVHRFGAEVRISYYETQATRLHAKAWLFRRFRLRHRLRRQLQSAPGRAPGWARVERPAARPSAPQR